MKMKTNTFYTLAAIGAALFLTAACAGEDTANKQDKENEAKGFTAFVESDKDTRTTTEYDGSGLNFYWTAGDRLWVNTGTAASPVLSQDVDNNIAAKLENNPANSSAVKRAATAKFYFNGTFTATSYPVRYTGKNGAPDKVTIKASQRQNVPNDASHVGEDGDFAVATATKPAGGAQYHFTLDHKAAYITFLPYTTQGVISGVKIQKIRVFTGNTSDALAGTFDLADNGTLSNATATSNSVELTVPNFSIPGTESYATNGATMVVNPGTYSNVSIEYTLYDPVTYASGTITKTYPNVTFAAGKNKRVKTDLQVTVYPANEYYQWDAPQQYWEGFEWDGPNPTQPTTNYSTNTTDAPQSTSTTSAHTPRDFNDIMGYNDPTGTAPAVLPTTTHFQALPNANEICWYVKDGDPHWDTELWATMGHLYSGGMWIKRKSKISGFRTDKAPDGTDYTRSTINPFSTFSTYNIPNGKPDNLSDYFYLPALGVYGDGILSNVGAFGHYWSSTPCPASENYSYSLVFSSNLMILGTSALRHYGRLMWTAE